MKVVHLSYYAGKGGAWTAIDGLNVQLQRHGVDSRILCAARVGSFADRKDIDSPRQFPLRRALLQKFPHLPEYPIAPWVNGNWNDPPIFSNWIPRYDVANHPWVREADVVHVQWIIFGLATPEQLPKLNKPLLVSMLDFWPISGGCGYTYGCEKYRTACGSCPQMKSSLPWDPSKWNWHRKHRVYRKAKPTFVTLSRQMARDAESSPIIAGNRVVTIPTGIDTDTFAPADRLESCQLLKLPPGLPIILMGAQNPAEKRKGFDLLLEAVHHLHAERGPTFGLAVYGTTTEIPWKDIPVPAFDLGRLETPLRKHAYRAAAVFAAPSREENFASTVLEALASGCPTVAFDIGGMPDAIIDGEVGYLCKPYDTRQMAEVLGRIVGNPAEQARLATQARRRALDEYSLEVYARKYSELYASLAAGHAGAPLNQAG
jgi:glycosyltransferase involved in cell wall biosynthesis